MNLVTFSTAVHQNNAGSHSCNQPREFIVKAKSADVVDNLGSRFDGAPCHRSTVGIDRYRDLQHARERFNHRNNPTGFFFFADTIAARSRRLPADVENIGSLLLDFLAVGYRGVGFEKLTAI